MARLMNLVLNVWRQKNKSAAGAFVRYEAKGINDHMSFLEMLDVVNEGLSARGEEPIAFDHDCREGICGACGMVINGVPHGPAKSTTTCQLHMRLFNDGDEITIEPWRAAAFPVVRDLFVDRTRLFNGLKKIKGWVPVDGYHNAGPGPRQSQEQQQTIYPITECISCACCLEACPQYSKIELARREGETDEQFEARKRAAHERGFVGAAIIAQTMRFNYDPTGKLKRTIPAVIDVIHERRQNP